MRTSGVERTRAVVVARVDREQVLSQTPVDRHDRAAAPNHHTYLDHPVWVSNRLPCTSLPVGHLRSFPPVGPALPGRARFHAGRFRIGLKKR